jgi:hypothetical protein
MVTSGDNTEELCRALDDLFLEGRCIYSSFAVLSQFDFLLRGSRGTVGRSRKKIVNLLVVDFQIADPQQELPMWGLSDEGKDVGDCEWDDTGRSCCSLHREGLSSSCHTICKDCPMMTLHDTSDETFGSRIINLGVVFLWIKDIIWLNG